MSLMVIFVIQMKWLMSLTLFLSVISKLREDSDVVVDFDEQMFQETFPTPNNAKKFIFIFTY